VWFMPILKGPSRMDQGRHRGPPTGRPTAGRAGSPELRQTARAIIPSRGWAACRGGAAKGCRPGSRTRRPCRPGGLWRRPPASWSPARRNSRPAGRTPSRIRSGARSSITTGACEPPEPYRVEPSTGEVATTARSHWAAFYFECSPPGRVSKTVEPAGGRGPPGAGGIRSGARARRASGAPGRSPGKYCLSRQGMVSKTWDRDGANMSGRRILPREAMPASRVPHAEQPPNRPAARARSLRNVLIVEPRVRRGSAARAAARRRSRAGRRVVLDDSRPARSAMARSLARGSERVTQSGGVVGRHGIEETCPLAGLGPTVSTRIGGGQPG